MENWNELLKRARMDQRELAKALDTSPSVISALVNNVTGKAAAGKKLKLRALDYLLARTKSSESVESGRSKSELPPVALAESGSEYKTLEQWKHRALMAEEEIYRLRQVIHQLTAPPPKISSLSRPVPKEISKLLDAADRADQQSES